MPQPRHRAPLGRRRNVGVNVKSRCKTPEVTRPGSDTTRAEPGEGTRRVYRRSSTSRACSHPGDSRMSLQHAPGGIPQLSMGHHGATPGWHRVRVQGPGAASTHCAPGLCPRGWGAAASPSCRRLSPPRQPRFEAVPGLAAASVLEEMAFKLGAR